MPAGPDARELLLQRVVSFAADEGIAGKSLREIATGVGTSHRMLLYHFGSHEGLMAAIVGIVEAETRSAMTAMTARASTPRELMVGLWEQVASPETRPFVRLFFEVFGLAAQGVPGTEALLESLTSPWLEDGIAAATQLGHNFDATAIRLGVAVSRGLLLDLLAGADQRDVTASYELFIDIFERWAGDTRSAPSRQPPVARTGSRPNTPNRSG
jgi:AcrR family transcriptional regulator